ALAQTEHREITGRSKQLASVSAEERMRAVLDQRELPVIADSPDGSELLRKAEVMRNEHGTSAVIDAGNQIVEVERKIVTNAVEPDPQAGPQHRLDLVPAILTRDQ